MLDVKEMTRPPETDGEEKIVLPDGFYQIQVTPALLPMMFMDGDRFYKVQGGIPREADVNNIWLDGDGNLNMTFRVGETPGRGELAQKIVPRIVTA